MHVWQDTITLPGTCDSWTFAFEDCCRNSSNNLTGTGNDYYWETVLNSNTSPSNSSPVITSQPIPYYCINQPVIYNFGVYEPDGDSLHYSLINAMTGPTTTAPYQGGFSGAVPIPGININPNTGEITFTPTATAAEDIPTIGQALSFTSMLIVENGLVPGAITKQNVAVAGLKYEF